MHYYTSATHSLAHSLAHSPSQPSSSPSYIPHPPLSSIPHPPLSPCHPVTPTPAPGVPDTSIAEQRDRLDATIDAVYRKVRSSLPPYPTSHLSLACPCHPFALTHPPCHPTNPCIHHSPTLATHSPTLATLTHPPTPGAPHRRLAHVLGHRHQQHRLVRHHRHPAGPPRAAVQG
jgi:hypothetical protein